MFIDIEMLDDSTITIEARSIVRFRESFTVDEPNGSTVLDYGGNRVFCAETPDTIIQKAGAAINAIKLTMPNGQNVYVDAGKISELKEPIDGIHHPRAKCIVFLGGRMQQVQEDRETIKSLLQQNRSRISSAPLMSSIPAHFFE